MRRVWHHEQQINKVVQYLEYMMCAMKDMHSKKLEDVHK
jgi:hypothetical protein